MLERELVEKLGELLAKATPGEWDCCDGPNTYQHRIRGQPIPHKWGVPVVCDVIASRDAQLIVATVNALPELLRVYRAWLDAPVGEVESIDMCTDRPTWHVMDKRGMVSLEIGGKQVRLVRDGDSGEG